MNSISTNINPLLESQKEKDSALSLGVREKLDALRNMNPKDYQLRVIKRTRNVPQDGDVFILSPQENVFFYGKVLKSNIKHIGNDTFIDGKNLIFIFKSKTQEPNLSNYKPNYDNLLIQPAIVDRSYWTRGFFYTISNEPSNEFEKSLDYGFYKTRTGEYYKEDGVKMDHKPEILGLAGIMTIIGIAYEIAYELIIDPSLLEF